MQLCAIEAEVKYLTQASAIGLFRFSAGWTTLENLRLLCVMRKEFSRMLHPAA